MMGSGYFILILVTGGISGLVGMMLKKKISKYEAIPLRNGSTGAEVAKKMLTDYGIHDVQVIQGQGRLTDHYNPQSKTISLSPSIYSGSTIAAAAVAAHECGHAVQHNEAYGPLAFRSAVVPLVQFSSNIQQFIFMAAMMVGFGASSGIGNIIMIALIAVFSVTALFSIITLPVEFDASKRALAWLDNSGFARGEEYDGSKDALRWAAMTYVAAALSSILMVLYFVFKFMGSQNRR